MSNEHLKDATTKKDFIFFVKKYLKLIIAFSSLFLLILILFFYIFHQERKKNIIISNQFNKANILLEKKETENAKKILLAIIEKNNNFYSPLSLNILIDKKIITDKKELVILFDNILKIKKIDDEDKNLIKIKKALLFFDKNNEKEILNILNPIINSNSVWRQEAIKLIVEFFKYTGELKKSEEYLGLLSKSKN